MHRAMRKRVLPFVFILSIVLPGGAETAHATGSAGCLMETATTFADMIETVKPAVVHIVVKKVLQKKDNDTTLEQEFFNNALMKDFFGDQQRQKPEVPKEKRDHYAHGSGFVINSEGYILTNAHVIANAEEITVFFPDKRSLKAEVKGADPLSDVALLRVEASNLPALRLGSSESLRVGEWAIAIGSPFETIQTVTAGIVSAKGRSSVGISEYEDFIQTDAAINPGNSGGPLLNIHGQVIGINTAFLTQTGGYMGIGFAIPIDMARIIAGRLQTEGKMTRAWLGVALKDVAPEMLAKEKIQTDLANAALVFSIEADSPATKSSLRKGDLITSLDGVQIAGAADLRNRIALSTPGSTLSVQFFREGRKQTTKVVLGEKKEEVKPH